MHSAYQNEHPVLALDRPVPTEIEITEGMVDTRVEAYYANRLNPLTEIVSAVVYAALRAADADCKSRSVPTGSGSLSDDL